MMNSKNVADRVADYILRCREEQLRELTINQLTRNFNISKPALTSHFKECKGITPGKFILREKMNRAVLYLDRDRSLTVKRLTEIMGFCKCDYFIQVFKDHFGLPPNKYRELRLRSN